MTRNARLTVADLLNARGQRSLCMLRVTSIAQAAAAAKAGIDILSVPPSLLGPELRAAAPAAFVVPGLDYGVHITEDDYLRAAFDCMKADADAVYCSGGLSTVERLAHEGIPVCGHVGLIPYKRTWTGGWAAVGKTLQSAQHVWRQVRDLEQAGAFAAEIEVVPEPITAEIAQRTTLFLISMGAGRHGHAQYLFAEDVLGLNEGHIPRHARVYRDMTPEYDRLNQLCAEAFTAFAHDVRTGGFPAEEQTVSASPDVREAFSAWLEKEHGTDHRATHPGQESDSQ